MKLKDLQAKPNALAQYYSQFKVDQRLLLTGHSHQAWPDCGFEGQKQAWLDAAELVDAKWDKAFEKAQRVQQGFATLLDDHQGHYALAANTHDLVVRFISALPLGERPKIISTDGEYHSLRRQLCRLEEEGVEVVRISTENPKLIAEKLINKIDDKTSAVMVSAVLFQNGYCVPDLGKVLEAAQKVGAELLVDAYHAINVLAFSLEDQKLTEAFVVGGGYKYCQLGEGNCFLRIPLGTTLRPVVTGWFSEFSAIADEVDATKVVYGTGADRFAGSTYDPTSHYRAARVFDFLKEQKLTPTVLREVNQHQVKRLASTFDQLDLDPVKIRRDTNVALEDIGGFLALIAPEAQAISTKLKVKGVFTDARANRLRFGPAPYHCDNQLEDAMRILGETLKIG